MNPGEHSAGGWAEVARMRASFARPMLGVAIGVLVISWAWTAVGVLLMGGVGDPPSSWGGWWDPALLLINGLWFIAHLITGIGVISAQRAFTRCAGWFGVVHPSPGLAWGSWSWFVPIANLFVPYQAFRQLTRVLPETERGPMRRSIGRWWAFWLVGSISSSLATKISLVTETPRAWIIASTIDLVGSASLIAAGLMLIGILGRLSRGYARLAADREERLVREAEERLAAERPRLQLDMPFQPVSP